MPADGALAGRVAFVTGGGTGLGRAMALELGRRGAKVAVVGRRREPLDETVAMLDGPGFATQCDVREPEAVAAAFDAAEDLLGPVTTLVNNAAGNFLIQAEDLSPEWSGILRRRREMFRGMREDTVARLGQSRYDEYDQLYAFFVGLVEAGKLGGARFSATAGPGIS